MLYHDAGSSAAAAQLPQLPVLQLRMTHQILVPLQQQEEGAPPMLPRISEATSPDNLQAIL